MSLAQPTLLTAQGTDTAKFPTMEFVADAGEPSGWRRITHEKGVVDSGLAAAFTAEDMDEAVVAQDGVDAETDRHNANS